MRVSGSCFLRELDRAECILKELRTKMVRLYVDEFQERCCINAWLKALKRMIAVVVNFSTVIK